MQNTTFGVSDRGLRRDRVPVHQAALRTGSDAARLCVGADDGRNSRRSLLLSRGDFSVFVTRPLSIGLLIVAAVLVLIVATPSIKAKREEAFQEE